MILAGIPVTPATKPGDACDCVIVQREVAPEFLKLIQKVTARSREARWCVYGDAARSIRASSWNDLVLSESVVNRKRTVSDVWTDYVELTKMAQVGTSGSVHLENTWTLRSEQSLRVSRAGGGR